MYLMTGQTISHYRIEQELGKGGMGVVYRARDERLQRSVALKLLPEEMAGHAERRARILAEARAASALNHPGIITIYEVGEEGDQLFIVMELVAGQSLRSMIAQGPIEPHTVARLGALVVEALAAAHAQGIIHGDVKPENILVQPDGRVKLLDFGIARQMAEETLTMTRAGPAPSWMPESQVAGTLAYMAPELWRGQAGDARADLFSLGVVLYEMAAGRRPFPGPTATALMAQIQRETPPPLGTIPGVPSELARVAHKLLEKQPDSRYQTAREVQVDLTNLLRDLELGPALPAAVAGKRAVAVLPFKLLTPNPEDDYLTVALADAVINQLGAGGELLVRPTSTIMRYAKQAADPLIAARELNVQVIVDGSIQKFGQKLRVHVQAWNAADGSTLLSAKHDAEMADLFGLQDRIADGLSRALGARAPAAAEAPAEPPTKNPVAYQLFLRAVERLSRLNRWDTTTAIEMLENATELDPHFADAWARLAEACLLMAISFDPKPRWLREAERAARRALAIDPGHADGHCARGRILWAPAKGFQHRAALRALRQALRLNPGCQQARIWASVVLQHVGLIEEATEEIKAVLATNPDDAYTLHNAAHVAHFAGNYQEAKEYFARALSLEPSHLWANIFLPASPLYAGELDLAEEKLRVARQVAPNDQLLTGTEALLWAKRGENRKAEQAAKRTLKDKRLLTYTHHAWHYVAAAYAVLGKPAQAVALLRKASVTGLPNYPGFRDDPHFQSLHNHPQFLRLMADLKREWEGYKREFGRA